MTKGWFTIPGVQEGERDMAERVVGLEKVKAAARGKSVLDLGCAEGLIGDWLIKEGGAVSLLGLEKHPPYVEMAKKLVPCGYFFVADFDTPGWDADLLRFDVVLALNIAHKLEKPEAFLDTVVSLAKEIIALSLPAVIINDHRSGNVPVDVIAYLQLRGFDLIDRFDGKVHPTKGHLGIRLIFKRREKCAVEI